MSALKKYDSSNEILVRREEIIELFSDALGKRPSRAAFFRYVDQGTVKKARKLKGWYKLNATRVELGMGSVDVTDRTLRRLAVKQFLKHAQMRAESVLEIDESLEIRLTSFKRPDEMLPSEERDTQREVLILMQELGKLMSQDSKDAYLRGYFDAINSLMTPNEFNMRHE